MRKWAFARISLQLTDEEFFRYTPAQIEALTESWTEKCQWELAVQTACALNQKWSKPDNLMPFSPLEFIPKTEEEEKASQAARVRAQQARETTLELRFAAMANSLSKKTDGKK